MSLQRLLMIVLLSLWCPWSSVYGQGGHPSNASPSGSPQARPDEASTQIGQSGYVVKVPEIKLRSIVGERPQKKISEPESPKAEAPVSPGEEPKEDPVIPADPPADNVDRLPFDPIDLDAREPLAPEEPVQEPTGPPDPQQGERDLDSVQEPPQPEKSPPKPAETIEENPVYHPPAAPEETYDPSFVPQKEILRRSGLPKIPALAELDPKSGKTSRLELSSRFADDAIPPEEWLGLQKRPEPALVELPEPVREQVAEEPRHQAEVQPPTLQEETGTVDSPPEKPTSLAPETETEPRRLAPPEEPPAKETLPPHQAKEIIATPLDDDALGSREARDYLRQTAPILEELSLLMTRAPGLTIADYDPSETSAALIPEDIRLKMASIKRELQVLDSKTFAVIPPAKYLAFHELVRQSIAQTYMACDAIINYFDENKVENFFKAKEHLSQAGDIIRRTGRP